MVCDLVGAIFPPKTHADNLPLARLARKSSSYGCSTSAFRHYPVPFDQQTDGRGDLTQRADNTTLNQWPDHLPHFRKNTLSTDAIYETGNPVYLHRPS